MKLSRIIELEIEGNEEILNFAEKEYKGGGFYISDIPIILKNFKININENKIILIGENNFSLNIPLRKIDAKAKKIIIILPRSIFGKIRILIYLSNFQENIKTFFYNLLKKLNLLGMIIAIHLFAPPYRNEFPIWEWSIWYATCWVGETC
jgi:hypothetical protein